MYEKLKMNGYLEDLQKLFIPRLNTFYVVCNIDHKAPEQKPVILWIH